MAKTVYQRVRGMHDILPDEASRWDAVERVFREVAGLYNYGEVRNPVLEATGLFRRSIGDDTDIVGKEMYSFTDAGGDDLSLRPEGTAGVVRAYVEHSLQAIEPVTKWYYIGPMFRRERPQKGRYRQFHQAGVEAFGAPPPVVDAEQVILLVEFLSRIGLAGVTVLYNHLGGSEVRERYRQELTDHYRQHEADLCGDCKRRLVANPLRLLDCKVDRCVEIKQGAPRIRDLLGEEDLDVLERFRSLIDVAGAQCREDARLVRGLDYYTGIVYEVEVGDRTGPVVVAGGGRYDGLVGRLGGPETPATGFAIGLERVLDCLPAARRQGLDLFVLVPPDGAEDRGARLILEARGAGLRTDMDPRAGSVKSQMKRAHKLGARWVVILGEREAASGRVSLKDMESGEQVEVGLDEAVEKIAGRSSA